MDRYSKIVMHQLRMLIKDFRQVLHLLSKKQKRTYGISIVFMFLSSLLELFTIGLLVPFTRDDCISRAMDAAPMDHIAAFRIEFPAA